MFNDSFWDGKKLSIIIISVIFLLSLVYFANFLSYNKMIYGSDWILSGYSNHYSWINYIKFHRRLPMWDGYNFSGNPIMATRGGGGMVYPLNIFYFIFPVHFGWTVMYIIHTFLAGLGMWLLLKEYKLSSLSSLVGAISFMFAGQLITTTEGGHLGRMIAAVFLPFAFLFLHRAMRSKNIRDFIIFGGITGLFLLAGHVQISYWAMLGIVIYFIYEVIRRRDELKIQGLMKITWFFSIGIVIILLIASIKLLPPALSLGYGARGVTRGYEYTTSWSLPTSELFNLVVPHFSGILNNYWGENFFKLDSRYLGILPLILFGFAFFYRKDRHLIKFFAFLTGITLILALGKNTPLFKIYYYLIPMAKKFRGPSMFFFLTTFGVAIISGFGAEVLTDLCREKSSEINKKMIGYLLGFVAIVIIATLIINIGDEGILKATSNHFVKVWTGILPRANIQQKISLMIRNFDNFKRSLWMTTLLTILNGGLIFIMLKRKLNYKIIIPFLLVILLIDVWSIDKRYIRASEPPERLFTPDDVTRFISTDKGVFRAYPFNYENRDRDGYLQYHGIENVGGYGPNPPKRYQEFIGAGSSVMFSAPNFITYPHLLSMLNVKYIIGPHLPVDLSKYDERVKKIIEQYKEFYSNFEVLGGGVRYQVLENKNTLPRVSLLYEYTVVDNEKEILDRILLQEFELGKMAFLEGKSEFTISEGKGSVEIEKYIANDRVFKIVTDKPAFLIVRENHHPHWKCYINGEERKIYRANYVFYGVFVPEGEHIVRFVYESPLFNIVTALSFAGFLIFLVAVVFSLKRPISRLQNI